MRTGLQTLPSTGRHMKIARASSIDQLKPEGSRASTLHRFWALHGVTCDTVFEIFLIFLHSSRALAARSVCSVPSR